MADTPPTQEPSMEEILASIRKIISEDGGTVQPADNTADEILELKEDAVVDPAEALIETMPIVEMEDSPPPAPEPEFEPVAVSQPAADIDIDQLMSDSTAQASASALSGLTSMMRSQGSIPSFPIGNGGLTLEAMVVEFIRPHLKSWLDQNLPALVERVVQKEIQKITRDMR